MKKYKIKNLTELPRAPRLLNEEARKIYYAKGRRLVELQILSEFDLSLFTSYCLELELYTRTHTTIENYGAINTNSREAEYSRLVSTNKRAWERVKILSTAFGFTPASRGSVAKQNINNSFEGQFGEVL
jgi:P27 family predicted phage terminase small subunit